MLEAMVGVLIAVAPPDPAREAYAHAKSVTAPPACPQCRDTCAPPPQQKCRELCDAGTVQACTAVGLATSDVKLLADAAARHDRAAEAALAKLEPDKAKAGALLGESCGLDYWPACVELAAQYDTRDKKFALELHERACKGGFAQECLAGAKLADRAKALKLKQAACALGVAEACPAKPAAPTKKSPP